MHQRPLNPAPITVMLLPTFAEAQNAVFASLATDEFFPTISTSDHKGHKGISADGWSSLIGIVTAIVGNIFISVALNTQRYAHIRLNKEWVEKQKQLRRERRAIANGNGQSTQQTRKEDKAKPSVKRRHTNGASVRRSSAVGSLHPATETDPLIPRTSEDEDDDVASDITDKERRAEDAAQTSYLKSPYWWLGLVLMITGEAGNFLAYGFAPASIVSPLGVVALISNCIIAPFMLKERFRTRDGVGVLIAIAGAVTVVVSAKSNNPKLGPDEIWNLIARWEFETYVGLTTLAIIALMVASEKIGGKSIFIDLGVAALFGMTTIFCS